VLTGPAGAPPHPGMLTGPGFYLGLTRKSSIVLAPAALIVSCAAIPAVTSLSRCPVSGEKFL